LGWVYQTTDESLALGLPEERIITALSVALMKNTNLGLEIVRDSDYSIAEGGTGQSGNTITAQLAVSF
jgi:hypothetical protein